MRRRPRPSPRPQWIEVERPHPAFELLMPELGGSPTHYAILRRDADGARKDMLTWGEAAGGGPYVMCRDLSPGRRRRALHRCGQRDRRAHRRLYRHRRRQAGRRLDSKFGAVPLVDFAIAGQARQRRCLGFARAFNQPSMQIAGWYCSTGDEVVSRATLACVLDRLTILSAGGDAKVDELFARAEVKRTFCGQRNPILAATPERHDHVAGLRLNKPHGRHRAQ